SHRQKDQECPARKLVEIIFVEVLTHDECDRKWKKIGTQPIKRGKPWIIDRNKLNDADTKQGSSENSCDCRPFLRPFALTVGFEDDQQPDGVTHQEQGGGKRRKNPFPQCTFEDKQQKIRPEKLLKRGHRPNVFCANLGDCQCHMDSLKAAAQFSR